MEPPDSQKTTTWVSTWHHLRDHLTAPPPYLTIFSNLHRQKIISATALTLMLAGSLAALVSGVLGYRFAIPLALYAGCYTLTWGLTKTRSTLLAGMFMILMTHLLGIATAYWGFPAPILASSSIFLIASLFLSARGLMGYGVLLWLTTVLTLWGVLTKVDSIQLPLSGAVALVTIDLLVMFLVAKVHHWNMNLLVEQAQQAHTLETQERSLLNAIPGIVTVVDRDLQIISIFNLQVMPAQVDLANLSGKNLALLVLPEYQELLRVNIAKVFSTGQSVVYRTHYPINDGAAVWFANHAAPIIEGAQINRAIIISLDITEAKRAELALEAANQRYDDLVTNIPDMVYRIRQHPDGVSAFDYVSPRVREINGVEPEDVLRDASLLQDNILPEYRASHDQLMELSRQRLTPYIWEGQVLCKGQPRWLRLHSIPKQLEDGTVVWHGIQSDITWQKEIELALQEAKQHYDDLVANIPGIVYQLRQSPDGELLMNYISPRVRDFYGIEPEAALGKLPLFRDFILDIEGSGYLGKRDESIRTLKPFDWEGQARLKDGVRWIRLLSRPQRQADGTIIWDGIHTDITAQKEAEQRGLELARQEERIKLLTHFVQGATHEFRTPLAIINTSLELLNRHTDPLKQAKYRERIQQQTEHIVELVDALATVIRVDSDYDITLLRVSIYDVVQATLEAFEREIKQKSLQVVFDSPNHNHQMLGDAPDLKIAFSSLLKNAIQHSQPQGCIFIKVYREQANVLVEFRDEGEGMERRVCDHAFDYFYRGDEARSVRGFGLGLPIAKRIVEAHQGTITLHSEVKVGTTVTMSFLAI